MKIESIAVHPLSVTITDAPGFGMEIDRDFVNQYRAKSRYSNEAT